MSNLGALQQLAITILENDHCLQVEGKGLYGLIASKVTLDLKNSVTRLRLLAGILGCQTFAS